MYPPPKVGGFTATDDKTVRYDWLNQELFDSLDQVRQQAEAWINHYNNARPNMGNGGFTPIQKFNMAA